MYQSTEHAILYQSEATLLQGKLLTDKQNIHR